jgi:hypothetical protein
MLIGLSLLYILDCKPFEMKTTKMNIFLELLIGVRSLFTQRKFQSIRSENEENTYFD